MLLRPPEPLSQAHGLANFESGAPALDVWLQRRAVANQATGASRTFVLCDEDRVVGYYALASSAVAAQDTPGRVRRNMPDPIPMILLARLAVARSHQGRGLGADLFADAARRVTQAADLIGVRGLLVHAISPEAAAFYRAMGMEPSPLSPTILMVTLSDLRAGLGL